MCILLLAGSMLALASATEQSSTAVARANPIRKVVNLLHGLQEKVTAEGEAEKELYEKFVCYCKTGDGELAESIGSAESKIPDVEASIKSDSEKKTQLQADLKAHKADREAAKKSVAEADSIREKEAAAYAVEKGKGTANVQALEKAVAALESGTAFLQTNTVSAIRRIAIEKATMPDATREYLLAFLASGANNEYAPQSGQIIGILKQMKDEMTADLKDAKAAEEASAASHAELVSAKKKEIASLTGAIETKSVRVGELGVAVATMKNDLEATEEALADDKKLLANLETNCATRKKEFDENTKLRADELVAIADTIKLLNDDDALELFKKTLPGGAASFLQVRVTAAETRARALAALRASHGPNHRPGMELIALALRGKQAGFDMVIKMIDDMVAVLKKEQGEDDEKKTYCGEELDVADDKKKTLEQAIKDTDVSIDEMEGLVGKIKEEIAALSSSIEETDKSVTEATEQRKAENAEYKQLIADDSAAKELLGLAKNRLQQFYNPKLATEEEVETPVFVQISQHVQGNLPPAPETAGAYSKKSEESTGIISMIDMLVADLDKELTTAGVEEKDAQSEYEQMMAEAAEKRAADSKLVSEKTAAAADLKEQLETASETKSSTQKELSTTIAYITALHSDCDWLVQYHGARKEARDAEIESLGNAKAVLSGADFSFLQTSRKSSTSYFLARH